MPRSTALAVCDGSCPWSLQRVQLMKHYRFFPSFALVLTTFTTSQAEETQAPARTGSGEMSFDTVPGWGLRPDGSSPLGPTHGAVVIDKAGNIYTSAGAGVFAFSPEGKVVQSYLGPKYSNLHDMEIWFAWRMSKGLSCDAEARLLVESEYPVEPDS